MRNAVLLLCSVLIAGTLAVAQSTPAGSPAVAVHSQAAGSEALPAPPPLHPITVAQAREMLRLTHADRLRRQVMVRMWSDLKHDFPPYIPNDVLTDMRTSLENVDFDPVTVRIYQEHISEKDAATIIAFYKTPAGQHLLAAMPVVDKELMEAGGKAGRAVTREVVERHKAEIQAAAKKYKAMHSMSSQP